MRGKSGEIGISGIILLISALLISTFIIVVIVTSSIELESEASQNSAKTQKYISTKITLSDLSSTYSKEGKLQNITGLVKIDPGSESITVGDIVLSIKTEKETVTLEFSNGTGTYAANGYYTLFDESYTTTTLPYTTGDDFDGDGIGEILNTNAGDLEFQLSSGDTVILGNCSNTGVFTDKMTDNSYIKDITGVCNAQTLQTINITPYNEGEGLFTGEYMKKSKTWREGKLTSGDIMRVYFEMPRALDIEEVVTINVLPKGGVQSTTMFVTSDTPGVGFVSLSHY